jgi:hypothetical protein
MIDLGTQDSSRDEINLCGEQALLWWLTGNLIQNANFMKAKIDRNYGYYFRDFLTFLGRGTQNLRHCLIIAIAHLWPYSQ